MTAKLTFLTFDEALALHADQLSRYGGSRGIRDVRLLESAIAAPRATLGGAYLHGSVPEMAAAYAFHTIRNRPFVDGNRRTALGAAIAFLGLNGLWLETAPGSLADLILRVADGSASKSELAEFLREHAIPLD